MKWKLSADQQRHELFDDAGKMRAAVRHNSDFGGYVDQDGHGLGRNFNEALKAAERAVEAKGSK